MRRMRRKLLAAALVLGLCLTGCHETAHEDELSEGEYQLWFLNAAGDAESAALGWEYRDLHEGESPTAQFLLDALFAGPASAALVSPFPADTVLRGLHIQDGLASVDLSEAYGGLSGADLTLADACVVLTVCQLEEVWKVYVTVEGEARPFRNQILSPEDFVLTNAVNAAERN